MRATFIPSPGRPRRLTRRDRNGHPAIQASERRRQLLPPLEQLLDWPRDQRTVTPKWEAA